jgi:hypothetical protein
MVKKIKLDDKEYSVENLSDQGKATLASLQFINGRLQEITDMQALLQRAKTSYIAGLKKEVLSKKAGLLFDD